MLRGRVATAGGGVGGADFSCSDDESESAEARHWSDESGAEEGGEEESGDESSGESGDAAAGTSQAAKARKRQKQWERKHFVVTTKGAKGGTVYRTELLPDYSFHTREGFEQFLAGNKFQKLLAECRKGMRTHNDNERLKAKAQARRARASERRTLKKREHRERRKKRSSSLEENEIARRKEVFQAKKARRLARKEAATRALGAPSGAA